MERINKQDRIHGCDVGRGVVIGYSGEYWWAYIEDVNLRKRVEEGKTKYIKKTKTMRITKGGKTIEVQRDIRIPIKEVRLIKNISDIVKKGDVVILERTGANGLRYARMFRRIGARVYIVDGKLFNRFQMIYGGKDDFSDAKGLYTYGYIYALKKSGSTDLNIILKDMKEVRLYSLIDDEVKLRYLINAYRRVNKDLTNAINRLRDHLTAFLPDSAPFRTEGYILNHLDEFPTMIEDPDYRNLVEYEIKRVKIAKEHKEETLKRIREYLQHNYSEEYSILKTIPWISDIQIAIILAYGGIRLSLGMINTRDELIGYAVEGTRRIQSGKSDSKNKDKMRKEVLGVFWMYYWSAHKKIHPLHPLVEYLMSSYGGDIIKKRYRKFIDKLLEIVRIMLKYRLPFREAIMFRVKRLELRLNKLYEEVGGVWELMNQRKLKETYHVAASLKAYRSILRITGDDNISKIIEEVLSRGKG